VYHGGPQELGALLQGPEVCRRSRRGAHLTVVVRGLCVAAMCVQVVEPVDGFTRVNWRMASIQRDPKLWITRRTDTAAPA